PAQWRFTVFEAAHRVDWKTPSLGREKEIRQAARVNRSSLQQLEEESLAFLEEVCGFYSTDPLLYFSGGKESSVMLRLLQKLGRRANLAFVGTGLDFPEDADFVLNT